MLAIYLVGSIATVMFAGVGDTGLGLRNPENSANVFTAIATPVMGPFAILLSLAVLSSCAASLQSTMISPARSLLAIAHHGALPKRFSSLNKFKSPAFATIVAGGVSAGFYALMRVLSNNVLNDTILALGMMICFYYGITALACVWYFRHTALDSLRNFLLRLLAPLLGGIVLTVVFIQTAVDSWDPAYGRLRGLRRRAGVCHRRGHHRPGRGGHARHREAAAGLLPGRDHPEGHPCPGGAGVAASPLQRVRPCSPDYGSRAVRLLSVG